MFQPVDNNVYRRLAKTSGRWMQSGRIIRGVRIGWSTVATPRQEQLKDPQPTVGWPAIQYNDVNVASEH